MPAFENRAVRNPRLALLQSFPAGMTKREFTYAWGNNARRAELKGQACTIVAHGKRMYSVLVEFEDGTRVITSRRALRRRA